MAGRLILRTRKYTRSYTTLGRSQNRASSLHVRPHQNPESFIYHNNRSGCAIFLPNLHSREEFFIDNLMVRIHCIIVMIRWTGLAPWEFEFPFPGSLTSTFLASTLCTRSFNRRLTRRSLTPPPLPAEVKHVQRKRERGREGKRERGRE